MGLLDRFRQDPDELARIARRGTLAEFEAVYRPGHARLELEHGTLLTEVLKTATPQRVRLANRLLDDGARVDRHRPLHCLLGNGDHDWDLEAALLARMLDAGADVNEVDPRFGTPLETIASEMRYEEDEIMPFLDVLLARPELDLRRPSAGGRTVAENLRKTAFKRPVLVERVEALLP